MSKRNPGGLISTTGLRKPSVTDQSQTSGVWTLEEQYQSEAKGTWANQSGQGYEIGRSLRFRQSAGTTLSRTPITAGNRKTWTLSFWTKRGKLSYSNDIIGVYGSSNDASNFEARFSGPTDKFMVVLWNYISETTAVFRDPSAWYHVVLVLDTTQAGTAAGSKIKVYINGILQSWSTDQVSSSISQNTDLGWNTTSTHWIGRWQASDGGGYYYDGNLAEVNFVDGQALDSSYFGYFDYNGVWQPKKYTGEYGLNGFYLPFKDTVLNGIGGDRKPTTNLAWTADGALTTSVSKFGGSSYNMASNLHSGGTGQSYANHNVFNKDFTIEFWYRGQASDTNFGSQDGVLSGYNYLVSKGRTNTSAYGWGIHLYNSGVLGWDEFYGSGGSSVTTSGHNILDNQWHHVAVTKSGTTLRMFVDGTQRGSGTINNNADNNYGLVINGMWDYSNGNYITYKCGGAMDDFRMYTHLAKYTANFSAPTSALPIGEDDPFWGYVSAAIPMDGNNGQKIVPVWIPNFWTQNNFSATAGVTYDLMVDSPTNGSITEDTGLGGQVPGNYCTINGAFLPRGHNSTPPYTTDSGGATLTEGNLTIYRTENANYAFGTTPIPSSGKWYWEYTVRGGTRTGFGINNNPRKYSSGGGDMNGVGDYGFQWEGSQSKSINGSVTSAGSYFSGLPTTNDVLGCAYDADNGTLYFSRNGTWGNSGNPATGTNPLITGIPSSTTVNSFVPLWAGGGDYPGSATLQGSFNFGQRPFSYTAPSGFKCLTTANFPQSSVPNGSTQFDIALWTGDGASPKSRIAYKFKPDFVWTKGRNSATNHALFDVLRLSTGNTLSSDTTDAESNAGLTLNSLDPFGFTTSVGSFNHSYANGNGTTYVGWAWKANGAGVTNTQGSITSTVSANTSAGFSIVTYSGKTGGGSWGHGLGVEPRIIIFKRRNAGQNWFVFHKTSGSWRYFEGLNTTNTDNDYSSSMSASSSIVTLPSIVEFTTDTSSNYLAYCFTPINGYSAIGRYTGNGSTDGPFVYTGFRPHWVMIKVSSGSTGNWEIFDTARNMSNPMNLLILPSSQNAESSAYGSYFIDVTANGFKVRGNGGGFNGSGENLVYMAFAENPFKTARAR